jgi:hypothetical protein
MHNVSDAQKACFLSDEGITQYIMNTYFRRPTVFQRVRKIARGPAVPRDMRPPYEKRIKSGPTSVSASNSCF